MLCYAFIQTLFQIDYFVLCLVFKRPMYSLVWIAKNCDAVLFAPPNPTPSYSKHQFEIGQKVLLHTLTYQLHTRLTTCVVPKTLTRSEQSQAQTSPVTCLSLIDWYWLKSLTAYQFFRYPNRKNHTLKKFQVKN